MDKQHVAVMLGMVSKIYGKQVDGTDAEITIELWHRYLCDEPDELVQLAFDKHIATSVYAPKPAEILELIEKAKLQLWHEYGDTGAYRLFDDEPLDIPVAYLPQYAKRKPKAFEQLNLQRVLKSMDIKSLNEGN